MNGRCPASIDEVRPNSPQNSPRPSAPHLPHRSTPAAPGGCAGDAEPPWPRTNAEFCPMAGPRCAGGRCGRAGRAMDPGDLRLYCSRCWLRQRGPPAVGTWRRTFQSAFVQAMLRRRVLALMVGAYVRDMRSTRLVFQHAGWQTEGIIPTVGLRQGCLSAPSVADGSWKTWLPRHGAAISSAHHGRPPCRSGRRPPADTAEPCLLTMVLIHSYLVVGQSSWISTEQGPEVCGQKVGAKRQAGIFCSSS